MDCPLEEKISMNKNNIMLIKPIGTNIAKEFIRLYHYATICPPITKLALGLFNNDKLTGVSLWGYGTRPKHTIERLFPSLGIKDYLELNRLCILDELPKNTESQFIARCISYIRKNLPDIKILFSWADGLRGKPGYVYQASNWWYGGFIWSQFYVTEDGEVIHPRLLITRYGRRDRNFTLSLGLKKIHGFQYRYCYFLCSHGEHKRLLRGSSFKWTKEYPKRKDLFWKIDAGEGSRESYELPKLVGTGRFRNPAQYESNQLSLCI